MFFDTPISVYFLCFDYNFITTIHFLFVSSIECEFSGKVLEASELVSLVQVSAKIEAVGTPLNSPVTTPRGR